MKSVQKSEDENLKHQRKKWLGMPVLSGLRSEDCADEFFHSEEFYVERALRVVTDMFSDFLQKMATLKREVLNVEEQNAIFLNIRAIYDFHVLLFQRLQKERFEGIAIFLEHIGSIMASFIPYFRLYTTYVKSYRKASKRLENLTKKKPKFRDFLELHEMVAGMDLGTLLMSPVKRLPQYLAFLGAIYAGMPDKESQAAKELANALGKILEVTQGITDSLRDEGQRKMVVKIQVKTFKKSIDIVSPHRYVVKHGDLRIVYGKFNEETKISKKVRASHSRFKQQLFVLFNDMLLFGRKGNAKHAMRLEGMACNDAPDGKDYKNAFTLSATVKKDKVYVLCAKNASEKKIWLDKLQKQIDLVQSGEAGVEAFGGTPEQFEKIILKNKQKRKKKNQ